MKNLLPALLLLLTPFASAAFIDNDTYSTDTATHLDWLDISATAGLTYQQVQAGAGGWLSSDWRVATGAEVADLFTRYMQTTSEDFHYGASYVTAEQLVQQMGVTMSFGSMQGGVHISDPSVPDQISLDGFFNDGTENNLAGLGELTARFADHGDTSVQGSRWIAYPDWFSVGTVPNGKFGTFLVRPSEVPLPTGAWLFGSSLSVFLFRRLKRR